MIFGLLKFEKDFQVIASFEEFLFCNPLWITLLRKKILFMPMFPDLYELPLIQSLNLEDEALQKFVFKHSPQHPFCIIEKLFFNGKILLFCICIQFIDHNV